MDGQGTDFKLRFLLPTAILLGGLGAASFFRTGRPAGADDPSRQGLIYRQQAEAPPAFIDPRPEEIEMPRAGVAAAFGAPSARTLKTTVDQPPVLERQFPSQQLPPSSRWGISMGIGLPGAGGRNLQKHKIVDGDTLPSIAQRYLGDSRRAGEILEANRDVLPSPDILPLGRELKIPVATASDQSPAREYPAGSDEGR